MSENERNTTSAQLAAQWIATADAVLITASNGLSISEGLNLFADDAHVRTMFGDLVDRYHIHSIIGAWQARYPSQIDKWRVLARTIDEEVYRYKPSVQMRRLKKLIGSKPYFIWTSNTDHHLTMSGFTNVFEMEGNWAEGICSAHPKEHVHVPLGPIAHTVVEKDKNGTLSEDDLPTCQTCGAPIVPNVVGKTFVPDASAIQRLQQFLDLFTNSHLVVLELGIGPRNQMIKAPTEQLVAQAPQARYITVNKGQISIPPQIRDRSIGLDGAIDDALTILEGGSSSAIRVIGPRKPLPKPTPQQLAQQRRMLDDFYPNRLVAPQFRPGSVPVYMAVTNHKPVRLRLAAYDEGWMYEYGDAAKVHCFLQDGRFQTRILGLDASHGQEHQMLIQAGTVFCIEPLNDTGMGFSLLSTDLPSNGSDEIYVPRSDELVKRYPRQRDLIRRFEEKLDSATTATTTHADSK